MYNDIVNDIGKDVDGKAYASGKIESLEHKCHINGNDGNSRIEYLSLQYPESLGTSITCSVLIASRL